MASSFASKRLAKELSKLNSGLPPGIELISADNFEEWIMDIKVLDDNPLYKDQAYRLKFKFSQQYPIGKPLYTRRPLNSSPK
ncbi:ubiquitin-conjugating enzyme [Colletotrichum orchidophilum]|uniref:Ubiquitin-conjugating enzyme n=1 Tax=Colletotrichum orchidophilum TaxID=1209926 RepID=A0A1G4BDL1_9PEZI|nr:ubiquitin-conjugating enzyme [Colletotrichum orchidophilum]OHE99539.1 ubiquitin-conjugating enzyme [Colletotrichum orchidophilum]